MIERTIKSSFIVYILFYAKLLLSKNCMFNMYSFLMVRLCNVLKFHIPYLKINIGKPKSNVEYIVHTYIQST
ncbi:hypothetical protein CN335_22500 [Bacillus thuringiensis]|nr:hypothetical protein BK762_02105 [Bacillus thuringiensis serovar toumanoffi]PFF32606.1 hypothetical protein CN335_22500 [Bacillus thuringiensis]PFT09625.1 hypothetical protein COK83_24760 [Bacillus thuringiensis]